MLATTPGRATLLMKVVSERVAKIKEETAWMKRSMFISRLPLLDSLNL